MFSRLPVASPRDNGVLHGRTTYLAAIVILVVVTPVCVRVVVRRARGRVGSAGSVVPGNNSGREGGRESGGEREREGEKRGQKRVSEGEARPTQGRATGAGALIAALINRVTRKVRAHADDP